MAGGYGAVSATAPPAPVAAAAAAAAAAGYIDPAHKKRSSSSAFASVLAGLVANLGWKQALTASEMTGALILLFFCWRKSVCHLSFYYFSN
jgi:hypothetical protein